MSVYFDLFNTQTGVLRYFGLIILHHGSNIRGQSITLPTSPTPVSETSNRVEFAVRNGLLSQAQKPESFASHSIIIQSVNRVFCFLLFML